jgi:prepilin-type N-terminal cleavage/methylation domain-containing protein
MLVEAEQPLPAWHGRLAHASASAWARRPCHERKAFTLVELLVVIGIIALLISILLPTLSRAREASRRTQCLSNLREVSVAFRFYALDNRDQVPLGYRAGNKQFNSMLWSSTAKKFVLFGWLYRANLMKSPKVFFCPTENDPKSIFATAQNPWPPGSDGDPTIQGYVGYGCRPSAELPDDPAPGITMPRLNKFKNKAILADLTATVARVDTRHRVGINVLFGDSSARWFDRKPFDADLRVCTAIAPATDPGKFNGNQDRIWAALDQ